MRHCIEATNGRERRIKSRRALIIVPTLKREPINHLSLAYISSIDKMAARAETILCQKAPGRQLFSHKRIRNGITCRRREASALIMLQCFPAVAEVV